MRLKLPFSLYLLMIFATSSYAQDSIKIDEPYIFDQYQIFLEEEIMHLIFMEYEKEEERAKPINGNLYEDKTKIILDNYDGKNRVKVTYLDKNGKLQTLSKSKCVIDPYSPL